ncbi:hypothetical protein M6B38_293070 [Iris pallida]|uniref:Uncharacterized protein n=1 Tax=Iris pallida TaxID=29817 RepID=A0AAX6HVN3_IRIPA|nr:hypothetical protein M6B38_293070 [Iris pallida]
MFRDRFGCVSGKCGLVARSCPPVMFVSGLWCRGGWKDHYVVGVLVIWLAFLQWRSTSSV